MDKYLWELTQFFLSRDDLAPTTVVEHDAYAAQAVPSPLVDESVAKVVHVPQVHVVEKTIEIPQLQTVEKIVDIPEIQTLEAVLHEFDDEELCYDDLEEICYMTRMSRKRLVETCLA